MAGNEVRIIGGEWKGRKLRFPATAGLRPTLGRVRETLFNWLGPDVRDARCLDLFAGSGALGFEALSWGAAEVTFVERDRKAALALRTNAGALRAHAHVRQMSAGRFLKAHDEAFDLVFFDPPFDLDGTDTLLESVIADHLTATGVVYVERSSRTPLPGIGNRLKTGRAGDCHFALLSRTAG